MAELVEGPRVLGLGLGLFLLILLWSLTFVILIVFTRLSSGTGLAITSLAVVVTAILLAVPRNPPKYKDGRERVIESQVHKIYDDIFVWKVILVVIMGVFAVGGGLVFLCTHCTEKVYPQAVKKLKL